MNKRIEELSLQCIRYKLIAEGARSDFDYKKFAELIVRECEKSIKSVPTHFEAQDKIIVECLKSIRETFRS
jgi:hypothetical protein